MYSNDDLISMQNNVWVVVDKDGHLVRETMEGRERFAMISDLDKPEPEAPSSVFDIDTDLAEVYDRFGPIQTKGVEISGVNVVTYSNNTIFSNADKDSQGLLHFSSEDLKNDSYFVIDGIKKNFNGGTSGTCIPTILVDGLNAEKDIFVTIKNLQDYTANQSFYLTFPSAGKAKNMSCIIENCSHVAGTLCWSTYADNISLTLKNCTLSPDFLPFNIPTKNNGGDGNLYLGNVTKTYEDCYIDESNPSYAMLTRFNDTKFTDDKEVKIGDITLNIKNTTFKIVEGSGSGSGMELYRLPLMYILKNTGKYKIDVGDLTINWDNSVISGNTHGYDALLFGPAWSSSGSGKINCEYTVNSIHFTMNGGQMNCFGYMGTASILTGSSLRFTVKNDIICDCISGQTDISLHPIYSSKTTYPTTDWECVIKGNVIFNIRNEFQGRPISGDNRWLFGGSVQDPFDVSGDIIVNISGDLPKYPMAMRGANYADWGECKAIMNLTNFTGEISGDVHGFAQINIDGDSIAKVNFAKINPNPTITPSQENRQNKELNLFIDRRDSSLMEQPVLSGNLPAYVNIYTSIHQALGDWSLIYSPSGEFPSGGINIYYENEFVKNLSGFLDTLGATPLSAYSMGCTSGGIIYFSPSAQYVPPTPPVEGKSITLTLMAESETLDWTCGPNPGGLTTSAINGTYISNIDYDPNDPNTDWSQIYWRNPDTGAVLSGANGPGTWGGTPGWFLYVPAYMSTYPHNYSFFWQGCDEGGILLPPWASGKQTAYWTYDGPAPADFPTGDQGYVTFSLDYMQL